MPKATSGPACENLETMNLFHFFCFILSYFFAFTVLFYRFSIFYMKTVILVCEFTY